MSVLINILKTDSEFDALQKEWKQLVEEVKPDSIFLTFEWLHTWWQIYKERFVRPQPAIITVRNIETKELIAILPLFSHLKIHGRKKGLKTLQLMGAEIESSDYLDLICVPDKKVVILKKIFGEPRVVDFFLHFDVLLFENIHDDSSLLLEKEELANILNTNVYHYRIKVCPFLPLPQSAEQLMSSLSKNFRSNLKRARNKLERAGFRIELVEHFSQIERAIENLFALHDQRFKAKQAASKFNFERRGPFHQQIARIFLKNNWLQLYQIWDKDKVIGSLYCYKFNDSMMYMQGGFDPAYTQYGLGNQIILKAIEDAIAMGLKKFDFMRGNEPYKYKWTKEKIFLHKLIFPISLKAKLFFAWQDLTLNLKKIVKLIISKIKQ
ncbi:GNAT family N-acetyltransferase [Calditrichota bacterium LG25]